MNERPWFSGSRIHSGTAYTMRSPGIHSAHILIVLDAIGLVLGEPIGWDGEGRLVACALDGLLEDVEEGEIDEWVVNKVVEGNLLEQLAHAGCVSQFVAQRLTCEQCHAREPTLEAGDVDVPLEHAQVP